MESRFSAFNRQRSLQTESQGLLRINDGRPTAREQYADGRNHQSGSRAYSRTYSTVHGCANCRAGSRSNPDGSSVTPNRGVATAFHQLRFDLHLAAISYSNLSEFEAQTRNSFYTARFLSFRNYAAHHLAGVRNHVSIGNHRARDGGRESIALLALVA
jgi:hypothetical protein